MDGNAVVDVCTPEFLNIITTLGLSNHKLRKCSDVKECR